MYTASFSPGKKKDQGGQLTLIERAFCGFSSTFFYIGLFPLCVFSPFRPLAFSAASDICRCMENAKGNEGSLVFPVNWSGKCGEIGRWLCRENEANAGKKKQEIETNNYGKVDNRRKSWRWISWRSDFRCQISFAIDYCLPFFSL